MEQPLWSLATLCLPLAAFTCRLLQPHAWPRLCSILQVGKARFEGLSPLLAVAELGLRPALDSPASF